MIDGHIAKSGRNLDFLVPPYVRQALICLLFLLLAALAIVQLVALLVFCRGIRLSGLPNPATLPIE